MEVFQVSELCLVPDLSVTKVLVDVFGLWSFVHSYSISLRGESLVLVSKVYLCVCLIIYDYTCYITHAVCYSFNCIIAGFSPTRAKIISICNINIETTFFLIFSPYTIF